MKTKTIQCYLIDYIVEVIKVNEKEKEKPYFYKIVEPK